MVFEHAKFRVDDDFGLCAIAADGGKAANLAKHRTKHVAVLVALFIVEFAVVARYVALYQLRVAYASIRGKKMKDARDHFFLVPGPNADRGELLHHWRRPRTSPATHNERPRAAQMNGFDSFFPSSGTPRNPYRHAGDPRRPRAPQPRQDRVFVVVGTLVCFALFVLWQGLPAGPQPTAGGARSLDTQAAAAAAALSGNGGGGVRSPRLKGAAPALSFKVMTFNLRFAGGNDGWNSWRYRKDHVADIINRYHPVLLGTQEGLRDQLAELAGLLKHPYARFGVEREENGEFEQIFFDTTVLEKLAGGDFWLSETPDEPGTKGWDAACVRLVTWGKFRVRATRQELFFFNTQLDHVGPDSRAQGSRLLWRRIRELAGDAPLFLVGDFNTYRHTDTYSYFTKDAEGPRLREAWPEAQTKIGSVSFTYHGWAGVDNDGERGAQVAANHIDWIFYRPQMRVVSTEVITEARDGRYPSDHYPIQAEFLFPSAADLPPPSA
ncbi:hypothetical protein PybrP1_012969 [[Pythium] brassicae (nom. inval.)]|nr:hypothetical protein PybrP1_012969 [[Pythium] brassicae (nom. inval.)]